MNKYKVKIAAVLMAVIMASGVFLSTGHVEASTTVVPEIVLSENIDKFNMTPGETITITVPVRSANISAPTPIISIDEKETKAPVTLVSKFKLMTKDPEKEVTDISGYKTTYISFDVTAKETAKDGDYPLYLSFITRDNNNNLIPPTKLATPIFVHISGEKSSPKVYVKETYYDNDLKAGDNFDLQLELGNLGQVTAKKVKVYLEEFTGDGILPNYTFTSQNAGDIASSETAELTFPLKVSKTATDGTKPISIVMEATDLDGGTYKETTKIYIEAKGVKKEEEVTEDPNVVITNVTQTPTTPTAGGNVTLSFYIENRSKQNIEAIQITPTNLTNANFSPDSSKPYQYVESISAGKRKKITMKFKVSDEVVEGLNEIGLSMTYRGKAGKNYGPLAAKLFVLNVVNQKEGSTPKLIISNFSTGEKDLKAGKTFDFTFDVLNTNSSVSAKNIKVTLTSADNIFSVTKGSNSFYIPVIKPGEVVSNKMNLKVKADSVTKAYPIEIKFEYEYEGMPKPADGTVSQGVSITETINLQVMENSRPSVTNVSIGYGETPMVNTPTTLNFEFCNLGKSVLSNVTARFECEQIQAMSNIFIGNVEPGSMTAQEIAITPLVEGSAKGKVIITYENSNGEPIDVETNFETTIMPMQEFDPGMDPGMDMPMEEPTKKPILPVWAFVAAEIVAFIIAIPIGKKVTIGIYKKRMLRKEQEEI